MTTIGLICNKELGLTGRRCILHRDHEIPCEGPAPACMTPTKQLEFKPTKRLVEIAFKLGVAFAHYDPRYLRTEQHVTEAVDQHLIRLGILLPDNDIEYLRSVVFEAFR